MAGKSPKPFTRVWVAFTTLSGEFRRWSLKVFKAPPPSLRVEARRKRRRVLFDPLLKRVYVDRLSLQEVRRRLLRELPKAGYRPKASTLQVYRT